MSDSLKKVKGITFWQSPMLKKISGLYHGFSCRKGGISTGPFSSLNMGLKGGDRPEAVFRNRQLFLHALGLSEAELVLVKQVHGSRVLEANSGLAGCKEHLPADALVTAQKGIVLGIMAADCVVLYFFDPVNEAIGLAHAGWRGTAAGIGIELLKTMKALYSTRPENVKVAISPSIASCCYEVEQDVINSFAENGRLEELVYCKQGKKMTLDLKETNRKQLIKAGVKAEFIASSSYCTFCHQDLFYSYRRDGKKTGSMMAIMALAEPGQWCQR
ncbi:MAG: peptidoglycan editing factor PgeF [Firmicutes bacterium]|nr:peptidoglycan editing factor PgeF [Bacillota bacterium]